MTTSTTDQMVLLLDIKNKEIKALLDKIKLADKLADVVEAAIIYGNAPGRIITALAAYRGES